MPLIRAHVFSVTNAAQIALFSGGDPKRMLNTVLIQMGFGIGLAIIFSVIAKGIVVRFEKSVLGLLVQEAGNRPRVEFAAR